MPAAWRRCSALKKNIDELLDGLNGTFYRVRQSGIDEELFDVVAGFEALADAPGTEVYRSAENLR